MTDGEIIGLFGTVYVLVVVSVVIWRSVAFTLHAKRQKAHNGVVGRMFRLEFRGQGLIILGGILGCSVGWVATATHMVVAGVLSVPTLGLLLRAAPRWMASA